MNLCSDEGSVGEMNNAKVINTIYSRILNGTNGICYFHLFEVVYNDYDPGPMPKSLPKISKCKCYHSALLYIVKPWFHGAIC